MEDIGARVGRRVQALRKGAGMTQDDLAAKAGVGRVFLSEIERGRKTPSLETLERLGAALEVDVTDFILEGGAKKTRRVSGAERLGRRVAVLAQEAPPDELTRFERLASAFFAKFRPRRRRS